jgi:hypothetical protein
MREGISVESKWRGPRAIGAGCRRSQHVWRAGTFWRRRKATERPKSPAAGVSKPCACVALARVVYAGGVTGLLRDQARKPSLPSALVDRVVELVLLEVSNHWKTLVWEFAFDRAPRVSLDFAGVRYSVSSAASVTASKIGGEGRFRRRSCSCGSSSRVRKSDRSKLLS